MHVCAHVHTWHTLHHRASQSGRLLRAQIAAFRRHGQSSLTRCPNGGGRSAVDGLAFLYVAKSRQAGGKPIEMHNWERRGDGFYKYEYSGGARRFDAGERSVCGMRRR